MTPLLPELFARQVRATPDALAVISGQGDLTYTELDDAAHRIAAGLIGHGVGLESVVGVLVPPGPDLVAALLGSWLAGGCYLPLDPRTPARRLREVVELAGATVVLADQRRAAELGLPGTVRCCAVSELAGELAGPGRADVPLAVRAALPRQAAYMIFTSGSTGTPKGVVVEHEGIANRVRWGARTLRLSAADRVLQKTPLTFDAAGWEIFAPLICGAPVTFGRPEAGRDAGELVRSIRERQATVLQVVPTMLRLLAAEPGLRSCTSLRVICSAGEALHAELCLRVREQLDVEILNTYGPTECSIDVLAAWFDPAQQTGQVPIGWPIDAMRAVLRFPEGSEAGDEPCYELFAAGPGVARGYHGDAARTAQSFVPDPDGPPGTRLYRTGDLVRAVDGGALVFAGRADAQVKINGVRIEPAEVEAALLTHPEVAQAAVRAVSDRHGVRRLAAWVVTARPGVAERLAAYLRDRLPPAMIPVIITEVAALPRTASGKTDHARLPEPDWSKGPAGDRAAELANTGEERIVLAAWRLLLNVDEIGLDDDFFRLGGHSLLMTKLAAQLTHESGLSLDFAELHYAPTARAQAQLLARAVKAAPIDRLPLDARLALSPAQERFWILDQFDAGSREYLLPVLIWLPGQAAEADVHEALARLMARHEVLRTRYVMDAEGLAAVIEPSVDVPLRVVDTNPAGVGKIVTEELALGFDLRRAPLFRASLIRDGGAEQLLLLVCHHISCDGWSARLLDAELRESVAAIMQGGTPGPRDVPLRYVDAVAWQRAQLTGELLTGQLGYWRETLAGLPALELPGTRPRAAQRSLDGAVTSVDISPEVAGALLAAGRRASAAPYVVFLTLWTVALAHVSGQWDFGVGTPYAARSRPELHDVVGPLLDVVVIRSRLTPDLPFDKALADLEFTCRESFARHSVPFDAVVDAVAPRRDLSRTPLFQAYFALADDVAGQQRRARDLELLEQAWRVARTDLSLTLWPFPDGHYGGALEYAAALYDEATVAGLASVVRELAARFAADPHLAIGPVTAPPGQLEVVLGFVRDLLGKPATGPDDDFIGLGGNSLLAARLLWHVQTTFDVDVSMRAFFDRPTAAGLADDVERLLAAKEDS